MDPPGWRGIGTGPTGSVVENKSATVNAVDCETPLEVGRTAVGRTTSIPLEDDIVAVSLPFPF